MSDTVLIDAHVHLHADHGLTACLDHAHANMAAAGEEHTAGVLMLAETVGAARFAELAAMAKRGEAAGPWRIEATDEQASLRARHDAGHVLVLIAGRQIATREGLEVLALATTQTFEDRTDIHRAIAAARASDGLVVLPYGVGKWSGSRGRLIRELLRRDGEQLFAGDNGNRLRCAPTPGLLRAAIADGTIVLPGSDPLPLPGQERRIASYGMVLPLQLTLDAPARQLVTALSALSQSPRCYGTLTGPIAFVRAQFAMQWRKRRR
jgi:hypothetical protein